MRSHTVSTSAPGHERRDHGNVNDVNATGWPLARHGKLSTGEGGSAMATGAEESRSFEILAQEVEELIERQPQFAFLKPCRQLEQHYTNKRNAAQLAGSSSSSFRHSHCSRSTATETMASEDKKGVDDVHPKPGSSTVRELLSCDGIELNSFVEGKSGGPQGASSTARVVTKEYHQVGQASWSSAGERRHGRGGHFHRNSGERIWRISSTRCSIHEKEAHIDLVAPAAAKFLMEMSPAKHTHASPPAVAVPFKWEDAPGRAKAHNAATTNPTLQLPPRLAVPARSSESFSRQLQVSVISHPLAGLFPCMGASSPSPSPNVSRQQDLTWMQYRASKSYGGVHRDMLPKSGKLNKSFSQPLTATGQSLGVKPRRMFSSELGGYGGAPSSDASSSSSILHGSRQSSSSRTYLSCELDASTPRTAGSKSSSSASYESIGEDFDQDDNASPHSCTHKGTPSAIAGRRPRRSEPGVKGLLKLCKNHGNCLGKSKSRSSRHHHPLCSPEVWAPTLATYFQRLDVNDEPAAMSTGLLEKQAAAPTSSGYLNSKGEPVPLQQSADGSPEVSPQRPTRLPYKMPSVAEQERGRHKSHRSARSLDLCPSPAYSAALEMLSPAAATLMASRRHRGSRTLPPPKPHRRVQFIVSFLMLMVPFLIPWLHSLHTR